SGVDSVAIGDGSESSAEAAVALGAGALATANDSVALGSNSVADQDGTVSVGTTGRERRIVNVADGVDATDAVNKGQLDAIVGQADANTLAIGNLATQVTGIDGRVTDIEGQLGTLQSSAADL